MYHQVKSRPTAEIGSREAKADVRLRRRVERMKRRLRRVECRSMALSMRLLIEALPSSGRRRPTPGRRSAGSGKVQISDEALRELTQRVKTLALPRAKGRGGNA